MSLRNSSRPKKALRGGDCARSVSVRQPRAFRSPSPSLLKPSGHLRPFQSSILGPQVFKHAGPKVFRYARPSDVKICFLVFDQGQPNHIFKGPLQMSSTNRTSQMSSREKQCFSVFVLGTLLLILATVLARTVMATRNCVNLRGVSSY